VRRHCRKFERAPSSGPSAPSTAEVERIATLALQGDAHVLERVRWGNTPKSEKTAPGRARDVRGFIAVMSRPLTGFARARRYDLVSM